MRSAPIEERLHEGEEIVVQVLKEPMGTKGARITSHVSLPGRYLVLMPTVEHVGVSRKITDEDERRRLKTVLKEFRQERGGGGLIARTAGQGREAEAFLRDGRYLSRTWDEVRALAARQRAPVLLYREPTLLERLLRDLLSDDVAAIRLDSERDFQRTLELVGALEPALAPRVRLHNGAAGILEEHGVTAELERALRSKVWLPTGGYIVINQTEALVAIDVNTGRFVGKNQLEETLLQGQPRRRARDRAPDPAPRPGRDHRGRLHRHGGAQEPARGAGRARAGAAQGPLAHQALVGERVRARDPDPEARQAVARQAAALALPVLLGQRAGEERRDRVLGDLRRGAASSPPTCRDRSWCCA